MRRIAVALAATLCAAFAVPTSAGAIEQSSRPSGMSEGVTRDASGKIVGGWKVLDLESQGGGLARGNASGPSAPLALSSVEYPGGGTWKYGTYVDGNGYKHCWSFYHHPTVKHSATADMSKYANDGTPHFRQVRQGVGGRLLLRRRGAGPG